MEGDSKGFMSKNRDHWDDPSRERILREALKEALGFAKKKEVPPEEVSKVWDLILKDDPDGICLNIGKD